MRSVSYPHARGSAVCVRFVVNEMALGQVFLQGLRLSAVSIIPPVLVTDAV